MSLRLDARASSIAWLTLLACATGLSAARAALATDGPTRPVLASVDITSAGPLTAITLGNELSCQVSYTGDKRASLFPPLVKPGDCGTFLVTGGALFAPVLGGADTAAQAIGPATVYTPRSQSAVAGAGTSASPFKVTTVADAVPSGIRLTQLDSYVSGEEAYRTDVTLTNSGGSPASGILYRAGDCYLQESDTGFGFVDDAAGAVGCSLNANNTPAGRIEQWYPVTPGSTYMEGRFSDVWTQIGTHTPFPDTSRATEPLDNGAGISWTWSLAPGARATYSHYTTFSPTGATGPPPSAIAIPAAAFGTKGLLESTSNKACLSRRWFRIKLRKKYWPVFSRVTVAMPAATRVLRRKPWGTIVDLRKQRKGAFTVRITARTTAGRTIKGTRKYRTCKGRLTGVKPKL